MGIESSIVVVVLLKKDGYLPYVPLFSSSFAGPKLFKDDAIEDVVRCAVCVRVGCMFHESQMTELAS
jgi:hypothetical protein